MTAVDIISAQGVFAIYCQPKSRKDSKGTHYHLRQGSVFKL